MKQYKKTLFKVILIVVITCVLLQKIDMEAVFNCLKYADRDILWLAFLLLCFQCVVLALKWKILLSKTSLISLLGGILTSHVVTYSIGGQLAGEGGKILFLRKTGEHMADIAASVLVDKLTGLLGVFLVGFAGMLFSDDFLPGEYKLIYCISAGGCSCIVLGLFHKNTLKLFKMFSDRIRTKAGKWKRIGALLDDVVQAVGRFADDKRVIVHSIAWGIVQQAVSVGSSCMICRAMRIDIGFGELCWIQSLVSVISLVPLSVMGLGAGQVSVISLMSLIGIARESAVGYSLMLYIMQLGVAALSVIVLMFL